jgi:NAD-dependent dihydropyrimidine dehydrogenase PreA subunit
MPVRKIIKIDQEKCDGCGECVPACHEGAIEIIDGKARLRDETLCDGLGDCLGECPQGAITIEERQAPAFDKSAVDKNLRAAKSPNPLATGRPSCPGSAMRSFGRSSIAAPTSRLSTQSQLGHWPVQLMLVPPQAPFLVDADLLICADCVPFAIPDFHSRYLSDRAVLVGCPKLDDLHFYAEKLKEIFAVARPKSITVLKMEVPCCSGIAQAALWANEQAGGGTRVQVHTIGIRGEIATNMPEARRATG